MRTSLIASALTTLLFLSSAVNAAPVADAEAEAEAIVELIIERDADVSEHGLQKRQDIVTITRTAFAPKVQFGGRTRTITKTVIRTPTPPVVVVKPTPAPASTPDSAPQAPQNAPEAPATTAASTSSSGSAPNADAQSAVDTHNQYRALHQVGNLTWDDTLASYAASHAASCVFEHTGGPYGENLAAGYGSVAASITAWYNEINQYDFADGGFSDSTGHATQVLWKGSQKLGCAWVSCNTASTPGQFLMCEYSPPGNVIGEFQQNVFPET